MSLDIIIGVVWLPIILFTLYSAWRVNNDNRQLTEHINEIEDNFGKLLDVLDNMHHVLTCAHNRSHVAVDALQAHLNGEEVEIQVRKMQLRTTDREE